jgi:hypothetical protein
MDGRVGLLAALSLSVIVFIFGVLNTLPVPMTAALGVVICVGIILSVSDRIIVNPKIAIIASLMAALISVIVFYCPYVPGTIDRVLWGHITGVLYWAAVYPVAFLILEALTVTTGSKFNFPLLAGLPVLLACSIEVIAWVITSFFYGLEVDSGQISSVEVITSMFMSFILSLFVGIFIWKVARKKRFVLSEETCGGRK